MFKENDSNLTQEQREKVSYIQEWFKIFNLKSILFDFDDTLQFTGRDFEQQMFLASQYLQEQNPQSNPNFWMESITRLNDKLFPKYSVNPDVWNHLVSILSQEHQLDVEVQNQAKEILSQIYTLPSQFLDGAEEGLSLFNAAGVDMKIVTHANRPWTKRKYDNLQLERFIPWKNVYIIDQDRYKNEYTWREAFNYFNVNPQKCVVVGDSHKSDINPAHRVGVEHLYLVANPQVKQWRIHVEELPAHVRIIQRLDEMPEIFSREMSFQ